MTDHFAIYADWISGEENAASLGGVLVINQHMSVRAAWLRGNDQDRLSGAIVAITYTFDITHPLEW